MFNKDNWNIHLDLPGSYSITHSLETRPRFASRALLLHQMILLPFCLVRAVPRGRHNARIPKNASNNDSTYAETAWCVKETKVEILVLLLLNFYKPLFSVSKKVKYWFCFSTFDFRMFLNLSWIFRTSWAFQKQLRIIKTLGHSMVRKNFLYWSLFLYMTLIYSTTIQASFQIRNKKKTYSQVWITWHPISTNRLLQKVCIPTHKLRNIDASWLTSMVAWEIL